MAIFHSYVKLPEGKVTIFRPNPRPDGFNSGPACPLPPHITLARWFVTSMSFEYTNQNGDITGIIYCMGIWMEQYNKRDMMFECVSENGVYLKSGYFMWHMMIKCEMSG
jgi:hypothetical protein